MEDLPPFALKFWAGMPGHARPPKTVFCVYSQGKSPLRVGTTCIRSGGLSFKKLGMGHTHPPSALRPRAQKLIFLGSFDFELMFQQNYLLKNVFLCRVVSRDGCYRTIKVWGGKCTWLTRCSCTATDGVVNSLNVITRQP